MNKSCLGEMKGGVNFVEYGNTGRRKRKEKKRRKAGYSVKIGL
jgi:hypothetical protein